MTANPLCRDHRKRYFPITQTPLRSIMNANVQQCRKYSAGFAQPPLGSGIRMTANPLCRDLFSGRSSAPLRSTMNANAQKKLTVKSMMLDLRNLSVPDGLTSGNA